MDEARTLLERFGICPSKGLGQHFLVSDGVLEDILAAADLTPDDLVLEIGPGLGRMTRQLARRTAAVVAVELDRRMTALLRETLVDLDNVHIVQGDILDIDPARAVATALGREHLHESGYKVVANLPYYVTSAALRRLLEASVRPTLLVVMVQWEVAKRIVAAPGQMSLLAVSVQVYGRPEIIRRVPAGAFYPPPNVDSAVLRILAHPKPLVPDDRRGPFFRVVRAGFAQRRKQLLNSLSSGLGLPRDLVEQALHRAGISPRRRPQALGIDEWLRLAAELPG